MQNKPNLLDAQMTYVLLQQRIMKMYHFADTGNTNPIKPNFLDAKFFNKSDKPLLLMSRNISVLFVDEWEKNGFRIS